MELMGGTKIINVLKSDTFEEVFGLFKEAQAEEVIFIIPKGSRLAKSTQHFEAIGLEAERSNKRVSVMSSDPVVAKFAAQSNLDILTPHPVRSSKTRSSHPILSQEEPEPEYYDGLTADGEGEVLLTVANIPKRPARPFRDVILSEPRKDIRVKPEKEKNAPVEIRSSPIPMSKQDKDIVKLWAERERTFKMPMAGVAARKTVTKFFKKTPIVLVSSAIIILGLILYFTLGSAVVTLYPRKEALDFQLKVTSSTARVEVDANLGLIPGQKFTERGEETITIPVSGRKEVAQKASGKITIFNKSLSDQRLVATTRFRTPQGLIFRIPQTLTVPAARKSGSELVEGSVESVVFADRPGAEYNIGPARFTVPGFEGSPKFDEFYAVSKEAMSGGLIGPATVVTEEDFIKAEQDINSKLREKIISSIKTQAAGLKILDSVPVKLEPVVANARVGEAADNLRLTAKGVAEIIAFRENDVVELAKGYVAKGGAVELITSNLKLEYGSPSGVDAENKTTGFEVRVMGLTAAKLDKEKITKDILGMKENAIRSYFQNIKEVESARIMLSPFWVNSIPKDAEKVEIIIKLD